MKDLNIGKIQKSLDFSISITLLDTVSSTNNYLMNSKLEDSDSLSIVIARHQSEGYGRNWNFHKKEKRHIFTFSRHCSWIDRNASFKWFHKDWFKMA